MIPPYQEYSAFIAVPRGQCVNLCISGNALGRTRILIVEWKTLSCGNGVSEWVGVWISDPEDVGLPWQQQWIAMKHEPVEMDKFSPTFLWINFITWRCRKWFVKLFAQVDLMGAVYFLSIHSGSRSFLWYTCAMGWGSWLHPTSFVRATHQSPCHWVTTEIMRSPLWNSITHSGPSTYIHIIYHSSMQNCYAAPYWPLSQNKTD